MSGWSCALDFDALLKMSSLDALLCSTYTYSAEIFIADEFYRRVIILTYTTIFKIFVIIICITDLMVA